MIPCFVTSWKGHAGSNNEETVTSDQLIPIWSEGERSTNKCLQLPERGLELAVDNDEDDGVDHGE